MITSSLSFTQLGLALLQACTLICSYSIDPHTVLYRLATTLKKHSYTRDTHTRHAIFIAIQHAGLSCIYSWYYINCMYACVYYLCSCTHRLLAQLNTFTHSGHASYASIVLRWYCIQLTQQVMTNPYKK